MVISNQLDGKPFQARTSNFAVKISSGNVRYPSLSIDAGDGIRTDMWAAEPLFVALVLSDSSKRSLLEEIERIEDFKEISSLRFFLLIGTDLPHVLLYYRTIKGEWLSEKLGIREVVNVPEFGLSFPVLDLYKRLSISTAAAAEFLDCSRPYVIMLCEEGKLKSIIKDDEGHHRIPLESLIEWQKTHKSDGAPTYKEAAAEAGMYDISDEVALKKFRREHEK